MKAALTFCIFNIVNYVMFGMFETAEVIRHQENGLSENCCYKKTVGSKSYTLLESRDNVPKHCKNSCVYREDGTLQEFCFANGSLPVTCASNEGKIRRLSYWRYF